MSKFNPPKELSFEGNLSENWERWKKEFKFYLTATESDGKGDDVKTSRLLTTIGEKARDVYYTFTFATEGDDMKLDPVIAKFDEYFSPRKICLIHALSSSLIIRQMDKQLMNMLRN